MTDQIKTTGSVVLTKEQEEQIVRIYNVVKEDDSPFSLGGRTCIREMLNVLGIKVKGINA